MTDDKPLFTDKEHALIFRKLIELADVLGVFDEEEELSDTEIKDKDGVVYDLAELVKTNCVIDNGCGVIFMAIRDYHGGPEGRFVSSGGKYFNHPEDLAKLIREHMDDPDYQITVHKF